MSREKAEASEGTRHPVGGRSAPTERGDAQAVSGGAGDFRGDESLERYLGHLAQLDMPLAMKIEMIRALRGVMQSFVDRAFGDDPVQLSTGERSDTKKDDADAENDVLQSSFSTETINTNDLPRGTSVVHRTRKQEKAIDP